MESRTESCIALLPSGNANGDAYMFSLRTNAIVKRSQFTILPTPADIIDRLTMLVPSEKRRCKHDSIFHIWGRDRLDETPTAVEDFPIDDTAPPRRNLLLFELNRSHLALLPILLPLHRRMNVITM